MTTPGAKPNGRYHCECCRFDAVPTLYCIAFFKALANGRIYIGKTNTDPTIPSNQIQVYLENEDGSTVPVPQPIMINGAGFPVYNGQVAKIVTVEGHSMAVLDAYGSQEHYFPNVLKYEPDQFAQTWLTKLASPESYSLFGTFSSVKELRDFLDILQLRIMPVYMWIHIMLAWVMVVVISDGTLVALISMTAATSSILLAIQGRGDGNENTHPLIQIAL